MGDGNEFEKQVEVIDVDVTDQLPILLSKIWHNVTAQVNNLLEAHKKFGFVRFEEELNPTLDEVLAGFEFVDFALTKLLETGQLEYDEYRNAINSKQCIVKMKELSAALNNKEQHQYDRIIKELQTQSKF